MPSVTQSGVAQVGIAVIAPSVTKCVSAVVSELSVEFDEGLVILASNVGVLSGHGTHLAGEANEPVSYLYESAESFLKMTVNAFRNVAEHLQDHAPARKIRLSHGQIANSIRCSQARRQHVG